MKLITDQAMEVCDDLGILADHLMNLPLESFTSRDKDEPKELCKVRYEHFQNRRKCRSLGF